MSPETSYAVLLVVQAAHLLHHRLVRRQISFVEGSAAVVLCVPPTTGVVPASLLVATHLIFCAIQIIGSLWIRRLSPA
jgi:hypothetical protein